jgi:maleate cis-trans isomerase
MVWREKSPGGEEMYGWRARIGHVAPSRGDTLVYEFYKMFPEGFMMLNTTGTVRQLVDGDEQLGLYLVRHEDD